MGFSHVTVTTESGGTAADAGFVERAWVIVGRSGDSTGRRGGWVYGGLGERGGGGRCKCGGSLYALAGRGTVSAYATISTIDR